MIDLFNPIDTLSTSGARTIGPVCVARGVIDSIIRVTRLLLQLQDISQS